MDDSVFRRVKRVDCERAQDAAPFTCALALERDGQKEVRAGSLVFDADVKKVVVNHFHEYFPESDAAAPLGGRGLTVVSAQPKEPMTCHVQFQRLANFTGNVLSCYPDYGWSD